MRVSDAMLFNQSATNIDLAQAQVQTLTSQASTGIGVVHPWDDPGAAGLAVAIQSHSARVGAIGQATSRAANELAAADGALSAVGNALQQALVLAEQMGSDVLTASQRAGGVGVVTGLQHSVVGALNAQVGNRYLFGGTLDSAPPFNAAGAYAGNGQTRQVEVAPGVYQDASVSADVAIKGAGGGVDLFAALGALSAALTANNPAAVIASQANLNSAMQQVFSARSQLGDSQAALQVATTVNQAAQTQATGQLSDTVNVDEATVATQLAQAQTVLSAAVDASSKSFQLTLSTDQRLGGA